MLIRIVFFLLASMAFGVASSHHAFSVHYDINNRGTVEGVVEEVFWANPHVHFYIRVTNQDGVGELWDVEWSHLKGMSERGWTRDSVKIGDIIRVTGHLGWNGATMISIGVSYGGIVRGDGCPIP